MTNKRFERACLAMCAVAVAATAGCSKDEHVLATVGDRDVTEQAFAAYVKHRRIATKSQATLDRSLGEYLEREALADAIAQAKTLDPLAVEAELNELRKEMLIARYFETFLAERVDDAAIQAYYDAHTSKYEERKMRVAHILFRTNKAMSAEEKAAKLTAAREAAAQLVAGRDFAEVARERSEDRVSSGRGGDLGWIKQGGVDPSFSERIFKMAAGETSEPFESAFGYHIVHVLEAPQVVRQPLASVLGDIRHQLRAEARDAEMKRLQGIVKVTKHRSFPATEPATKATGEAQAAK